MNIEEERRATTSTGRKEKEKKAGNSEPQGAKAFFLPVSGETLKGRTRLPALGAECLSPFVSGAAKASDQGPSAADFGATWPRSFQGESLLAWLLMTAG